MAKRPFLGFVTVAAGAPFLAFLVYFVSRYDPPLFHWFVWEKLLIVLLSLSGGVLLWRGDTWGYRFSAIAWFLILLGSISSLVALFQLFGSPDVTDALAKVWVAKDIFYLPLGVSAIYLLVRDLLRSSEK
ncbi:MAG: hypothetical protein AB1450_07370 [Pseudomonadota bacterium]